MKTFISILCVGVLFSVFIEIFCVSSWAKKTLYAVLSLLTIYMTISGASALINGSCDSGGLDFSAQIELGAETLASSNAAHAENNLKSVIENEGLGEVISIAFDYHVENYKIVYTGAEINFLSKPNEEKVKELVSFVIPELEEGEIRILW